MKLDRGECGHEVVHGLLCDRGQQAIVIDIADDQQTKVLSTERPSTSHDAHDIDDIFQCVDPPKVENGDARIAMRLLRQIGAWRGQGIWHHIDQSAQIGKLQSQPSRERRGRHPKRKDVVRRRG